MLRTPVLVCVTPSRLGGERRFAYDRVVKIGFYLRNIKVGLCMSVEWVSNRDLLEMAVLIGYVWCRCMRLVVKIMCERKNRIVKQLCNNSIKIFQ